MKQAEGYNKSKELKLQKTEEIKGNSFTNK